MRKAPKKANKSKSSLEKIEIRAVESDCAVGAWARVEARLTFCLHGTSVSILEVRSALATCHRLAADLLEATPPDAWWSSPRVEEVTTHRDTTVVKVEVELAEGTSSEMERAKALLTEITNRLN